MVNNELYKSNESFTAMRKLFLLLTLLLSLPVFAQKVKTVVGEYTYHAPENVTRSEAKQTALERAQIQALGEEFGYVVSQENVSRIENVDGKSKNDFISIGGSDVKGEWLETIGKPDIKIFMDGEEMIVYCKVKGKAREIVAASIDFQAHVLRNGIEERFESDQFKSDDYLYLSFLSPVKGYLFSPNEFTKAADASVSDNLPRQLPFKDFQKWLTKCRKYDKEMNVKRVGMRVEK